MSLLRTIWSELFGMFVDDGSLAIAILAWVAVLAGLLAVVPFSPNAAGIVFFLGLAALLVENLLRRARLG